jgi:hypothetical protein
LKLRKGEKQMPRAKKENLEKAPKSGELSAKKDWRIVHNEHDIEIKKGQDCSKVPKQFFENLVTEGVISAPKKGE